MVHAITECLTSRARDDEVQIQLFDLLGMNALDLIGELLQKRKRLVAAIKYDQAGARRGGGQPVQTQVGGFTIMTERDRREMKAQRKLDKKYGKDMFGDDAAGGGGGGGFDPEAMRQERERQLAAGPATGDRQGPTADGSVAGFGGVNGLMGSGLAGLEMVLPEGAERKVYKKEGYEEVTVPAAKKPPPEYKAVPSSAFSSLVAPAMQGVPFLNRIQSKVFPVAYKTSNNMLVCAPTGAGKTEVAMMTVLRAIEQCVTDRGTLDVSEMKIVYVAPMKALASEVTEKFGKRLSCLGVNVKELTGDTNLSRRDITDTQMLVVTPEKWDVITRKTSDAALTSQVKLLIIDEIHLLNEERGAVIEAIVARTLRQVESSQTSIRIVGLSATLPTYKDVAVFLRVNVDRDLFYFDSSYRPVPLETCFVGVMGTNMNKIKGAMNDITYKKALDRVKKGYQVMVFVHSRKDTAKTAKTIMEMAQQEGTEGVFSAREHPQYDSQERLVAKSKNKEVRELFAGGFGVHHAGMLRGDRNMTERLFALGLVKVLVCTATLAWGVNLPAHTVLIKGTQIYDAKQGKFVELSILDVMQIFGRAGRPQFDDSGEGMIVTTHDKLAHYMKLMTAALPIESTLQASLTDHLNAEVVLGTVRNLKEAIAWLSYTYLYVRMLKNPTNYGVAFHEIQSDPMLTVRSKELIEGSIKELARAKMLRYNFETNNMNTTETGIVASHYYVKYASLELYNQLVHPTMQDQDVFDVVARSAEFENIQVRDEERQELLHLLADCTQVKIKLMDMEGEGILLDERTKVNILLQAYISRAQVEGFALVADMNHITQSAGRIFRALFELALKKGWVTLSERLLNLCKMVDKRLWMSQHELWQMGNVVPNEWLFRLEQKELSLDRMMDMSASELGGIIRQSTAGHLILKYARQFPYITMDAEIQPMTRTVLRVTLKLTPEFTWSDRLHGSVEPWWVWVEDNENDRIYHTEYFLLHQKDSQQVHTLQFTVPIFEPIQSQYIIRLSSDRWLHADYFHTLSFDKLILPDKYPSHTQLLKLCPLSKSALQNPKFESIYKFSHFNAVQTQIFHTVYHTDENVLLGAPTGSGKTNCCELAILRLFRTRPQAKVIYVAPMKALVRERMKDWKKRIEGVLGFKVVELTGDTTPDMRAVQESQVIVTTPEKWDGVSRNWKSRSYVKQVGLVIIDEIHLLGEDRGPVLEVIVSRMRYISTQTSQNVRFMGMSTAIANAKDVGDWLGVSEGGSFNFHPSVRPVPMQVHMQGYEGKHYCPRMASMNKPAYAAILDYSRDQPVIVFVSSRRQTRLTAIDIAQHSMAADSPRQFIKMDDDELEGVLLQVKDQNLKHTLTFGIGLHHAGLAESDRSLCETLFEQNKIQVLVSTSTLAWGVNLPAHLVIIKGTEFYDAPTKRYVDMPVTDILQMMGRAGRPQFDTVGIAVVMVHAPKKNFFKRFLYEPFPVESSLPDVLQDHFNAEIVAGTITCMRDAVDYLTWTYFFRRLLGNPTYYGLSGSDPETLSGFLQGLVQTNLDDLSEAGLIEVDGEVIRSTNLGKIGSYYYLKYPTLETFANGVEGVSTVHEALELLCDAEEFAELPVRHNEEHLNADLNKGCRNQLTSDMLSPHTKTHLLLQAHFGRVSLPIADYLTDTKTVMDNVPRVLQAFVDVCGDRGYLSAALMAMEISKGVAQGLWPDADPLCMLPHVNERGVKKLGDAGGINSLMSTLVKDGPEALKARLGGAMSGRDVQSAARAIMGMPKVQIECSVTGSKGGAIAAGATAGVIVTTRQDNSYKRGIKAVIKGGMKAREEGWWLVLGFDDVDELLAIKRIKVAGSSGKQSVEFQAPRKRGEHELTVRLVSDCYIGLDAECKSIFTVGEGVGGFVVGGGGKSLDGENYDEDFSGGGGGDDDDDGAGPPIGRMDDIEPGAVSGGSGPGVGAPIFKH